jgi:hypothetical protein
MNTFLAFIRGMYEFRSDMTTYYHAWPEVIAYDRGRDLAHRLTFRYWDE